MEEKEEMIKKKRRMRISRRVKDIDEERHGGSGKMKDKG